MQKKGGCSPASECVNDACLTRLARKLAAIALLPLFSLPCSFENSKSLQTPFESSSEFSGMSPARIKVHRPW